LRFVAYALFVVLSLSLGCAKPPPVAPVGPSGPAKGPGEVEDIRSLPQDLNAYLGPDADRPLFSQEQTALRLEGFLQEWTKPWYLTKPSPQRKDVEKIFHAYEKNPGFGLRSVRHEPGSAMALLAAADLRSFPNTVRKAITVKNTSQRGMPTNEPRFLDPNKPGEGYPFDYLQHTSLPPGTPLLVIHASRDGSWVYTESSLTHGWVPAADVAFVDDAVMREFTSPRLAAVIRDNVMVAEIGQGVDIGAVFPLAGPPDSGGVTVSVPVRGASGLAELRRVRLPAGTAVPMPMAMTPRNVATVGNQMMRQPYGWGGLDDRRDCSALTHDLYVPFGLYLPRNSASQAAYGGSVPLGDLPGDQKEAAIVHQAVPFATLVYMPGHIMVYVGVYKGRPVVFHNMWGFRTFGENGRDGRLVVGRAVVTTLRAGEEVPAVGPSHILLNKVRSLSILSRPY
jgi:hypothetical protein